MKAFLDSNVLLHFLMNEGVKSDQIAGIIEKGEASTSLAVLNEVKFRMLYTEAAEKLGSENKYEIIKEIKNNKKLRKRVFSIYMSFYANLKNKVEILANNKKEEILTCSLSVKYGLLPTDASIAACMLTNGYKKILTNDKDFKRVKQIEVVTL